MLIFDISLSLSHSVLWTAQGQILIQNSSKERMGTTSGIFWFMLESRYKVFFNFIFQYTHLHFSYDSLVVGSIYIFLYYYIKRDSFESSETFCFRKLLQYLFYLFILFICLYSSSYSEYDNLWCVDFCCNLWNYCAPIYITSGKNSKEKNRNLSILLIIPHTHITSPLVQVMDP